MKFYITTAIDYVNSKPHIGHSLEKVQADVLARYHRIKGDDVFFLTGTDEHGLKNIRAAESAGQSPDDFVKENTAFFRNLREVLNLSWDDFITTDDRARHWPGAQKIWNKIYEAGDLYKKKYAGLYCVGCEAFITEKELVGGKCPLHNREPESMEQENWFFRLSKYAGEIESKIKSDELRIIPESRKNEILSFIRSGLEDVSFSRLKKDLPADIPVPNDLEQVMYVWCDALSNYITAIGYAEETDQFKKLWPADIHVIGKDILRFHAAIWPGMLLSAKLPLPKSIFVHGFITVDGQKLSKSVGNVIDPVEVVKKYGTDALRYYLLREISSYEDGDFSFKKFEERYNSDLADGLGNLVARIVTLGSRISPVKFDFGSDIELEVKKACNDFYREYEQAIEAVKLHEALSSVWNLISFADKYVNNTKPWSIKDTESFRKTIANAGYVLGVVLNLVEPFLPDAAKKVRGQIWFEDSSINFKKGENLFPRLA